MSKNTSYIPQNQPIKQFYKIGQENQNSQQLYHQPQVQKAPLQENNKQFLNQYPQVYYPDQRDQKPNKKTTQPQSFSQSQTQAQQLYQEYVQEPLQFETLYQEPQPQLKQQELYQNYDPTQCQDSQHSQQSRASLQYPLQETKERSNTQHEALTEPLYNQEIQEKIIHKALELKDENKNLNQKYFDLVCYSKQLESQLSIAQRELKIESQEKKIVEERLTLRIQELQSLLKAKNQKQVIKQVKEKKEAEKQVEVKQDIFMF